MNNQSFLVIPYFQTWNKQVTRSGLSAALVWYRRANRRFWDDGI